MVAAAEEYVGLTPDTFTEGGSLVDDIDATITKCRAEVYNYVDKNGVDKGSAPAIVVEYKPVDPSLKVFREVYSVGTKVVPTGDGLGFKRLPGATVGGINKTSKGGIWLERAQAAQGCPSLAPPAGLSALEGKTVHLARIPAPKYGKDAAGKQVGKEGGTLLVITSFLASAGAKSTAATEDVAEDAREVIMGILLSTKEDGSRKFPDGVSKTKLNQMVFSALEKHDNRRAVNAYALSDACLKASDAPWTFDGKVIALPE